MKFISLFLFALSSLFFSLQVYAQESLTFENYNKMLNFKQESIMGYLDKIEKFEKGKRPLTSQERFDYMCHIRDFTKTTMEYINQYPDYKKKTNPLYIEKVESSFVTASRFIESVEGKRCSDEYVIPPYSANARWKELPPLGPKDPVIAYVDTDNYGKHSPILNASVVNVKELFKNNPDNYVETDYLVFCKTKETLVTRMKTYVHSADGPVMDFEVTEGLPKERQPINGVTKRIFDFECK